MEGLAYLVSQLGFLTIFNYSARHKLPLLDISMMKMMSAAFVTQYVPRVLRKQNVFYDWT